MASGSFEVVKRSEGDVEVAMRVVGEGEIGGLTNLAGGAPRSASLRAKAGSELVAIDKAGFLEAMRADAALTLAVLQTLGTKVRAKTAQVATLLERGRRDPRERVVFFDTKPYERDAFERHLPEDLRIAYVSANLGRETARLAEGYLVVCAFVNDDLGRPVLEELAARGVRMLAAPVSPPGAWVD